MLVVDVTFGLIVRFNVATESHPDAAFNVAVNIPACVMLWPFHMYGSCALQIEEFVVDVIFGLIIRFNLATESQPDADFNVAVNVPPCVIFCPFQIYGSCEEQIEVLVVEARFGLIVRFNVATESHPDAAFNDAVNVPACVML